MHRLIKAEFQRVRGFGRSRKINFLPGDWNVIICGFKGDSGEIPEFQKGLGQHGGRGLTFQLVSKLSK